MLKKQLSSGVLSLILAACATGCGGGGGGNGSSVPLSTSTTNNNSTSNGNSIVGNTNTSLLSGQFALLSATVGQNTRAVTTGLLTFDGHGGIGAGSGTIFNFVNNAVSPVAAGFTGGTYSVDANRNLTGQITISGAGISAVTTATNGRISTNQVYAGANFKDNQGNAGVFALIKPLQNGSNSTLTGTFRFSAALVGALQGFEFGNVTFDGAGGIVAGTTITFSKGPSAQVTNGTYSLKADGTLTGSVTLNNGSTAVLQGFVGQDQTIGVIIQDQGGNLGLGLGSRPPGSVSNNADLNGTGSFLWVITSPSPGGFVTGTASFNGNGGLGSGNLLSLSNGGTETITGGGYSINPDGTFSSASVNTNFGGGLIATANFLTLGQDKTSLSGVITDGLGNQGMVLLVK